MHPQSASLASTSPPPLFDLPTPSLWDVTLPILPMSITDVLIQYLPNEDHAKKMSDLYYKVGLAFHAQ